MKKSINIIISGGGTGGHIFPAISIANELKKCIPEVDILFIGALGRMEMERIPQAGYRIKGLPISGFDRKNPFKNIRVIYRLWRCICMAKKIISEFKPQIVIGVGGYASGPVLIAASSFRIPTILQEQNSYAGLTNKWLSKKASKICVAYNGMERFFPKEKIVLTGNPIRQDLTTISCTKEDAIASFNLDYNKKTILVLGGSLGSLTLNQSMVQNLNLIESSNVQYIWQTGILYFKNAKKALELNPSKNIFLCDFISKMNIAYKAADLVISRAGAGTISELSLLGKPCILVPSPNVSEDHQTKNAIALVNRNAALFIEDSLSISELIPKSIEIVNQEDKLSILSKNIYSMALPDAAIKIGSEIMQLIKYKE